MSGPYFDAYVLAPARDAATVERFLARWAPVRELCEHLDDPEAAVLAQLVAAPGEEKWLYWRVDGGPIAFAMLFFGRHGQLICGLSEGTREREIDAMAPRLRELADSVGARWGYVAFEEPPAVTFVKECGRRQVALLDGELR